MIDLISEAVGGRVVECNDQFFADADNLIRVPDPVWREGYTDRGKWMDGWETRRRRQPGHDWCMLALGVPGKVGRVTVDTSHFTGNYPEAFSLEACGVGSDDRLGEALWVELIGRTELAGDTVATFEVSDAHRATHLRLNIYPDGGVARLRVEGEPVPSMHQVCPGSLTDLASSLVGGVVQEASDMHFSHPSKMIRATQPTGMWDGWETRRRRGPGHDWATFRLGLPGKVEVVLVDTTHYKGNAPGWVSVEVSDDGTSWSEVVERTPVEPDSENQIGLSDPADAAFVRLSIYPDGGVARFRVYGRPAQEAAGEKRVEYLNALFGQEVWRFFHTACASTAWVEAMLAGRPYRSVDEVLATAAASFDGMEEGDWLEAFASHPRIGDRGDEVSAREQAGTADAAGETLAELEQVNRDYEERFGFTYIVYATGKTAEEMLVIARERLGNTGEEELAIAADQQKRITDTRLRRMLCQETS